MTSSRSVQIRPATHETWDDVARLFQAKGGPHYYWCTQYRVRGNPGLSNAQREACMRSLVEAGTPVGVLAYDRRTPVGWCSIAPRETCVRLERSRTMPRVTPPSTPTWTVLCFFVARPHRKAGVAQALLDGAVAYARERGAEVIEGYPFDSAGITSTHRGHSRVFETAGFQPEGPRWSRRV